MGLTTENAHLFTAGNPPLDLETVTSAIRQFLNGTAYEEAAGADDRVFTLTVSPHWISIYDTETGSLDTLVKSLSKRLATSATAIQINDSDTYSARLCRAGSWVDKISSGALRKKGAGHPDLWRDVLAPGSEATLEQALQGRHAFAEEPLRHLCQALRIPVSAALQTPGEISEQPPDGARVLRYRARLPQTPPTPPHLTLVHSASAPATAGQPLPQLSVSLANDGPAARGIRVTLFGDALSQGFIAPVELHVVSIISIGGGAMGDRKTHPFRREDLAWVAGLPMLELKTRVDPRQLPPGAGMLKAAKEYHRRVVHLHIAAHALRAGAADARLRIEWLDGQGAPLEVPLPITINPAP